MTNIRQFCIPAFAQARAEYEDILSEHMMDGAFFFDHLSFKDKKQICFFFLQHLSTTERDEILGEVSERFSGRRAAFVMRILKHHDEKLDPESEMADEYIRTLLEYISCLVEEDMEKLHDEKEMSKPGYRGAMDEERDLDTAQRARDMNAAN